MDAGDYWIEARNVLGNDSAFIRLIQLPVRDGAEEDDGEELSCCSFIRPECGHLCDHRPDGHHLKATCYDQLPAVIHCAHGMSICVIL